MTPRKQAGFETGAFGRRLLRCLREPVRSMAEALGITDRFDYTGQPRDGNTEAARDLLDDSARRAAQDQGSPCVQSGYAGWLLFTLAMSGAGRTTNSMYWHHGFGGGGPITKGAIDYSRYLLDVDADIIAAGHVHQQMCIEASRQRLTPRGFPYVSPVFLIRSASYKQECLTDGWAVEKGMSSRPLGGYWLMIRQNSNKDGSIISVHDHPEI